MDSKSTNIFIGEIYSGGVSNASRRKSSCEN